VPSAPQFDRIARAYRWLEYLSFGRSLERCRFRFLPELSSARQVLALGDGDGRFLAGLLTANALAKAHAVDISRAMLHLLEKRVANVGAAARLHISCSSVQAFEPRDVQYDLVVAHFFLDCLTDAELESLLARLSPVLASDARWVLSEFHIPARGWQRSAARALITALYTAFRWLTGLQVRKIPDYKTILENQKFRLVRVESSWRGILRAELWQRV
jgi:cyclopropane fatty-acyl-phospholipid synthase-like methyltransferase